MIVMRRAAYHGTGRAAALCAALLLAGCGASVPNAGGSGSVAAPGSGGSLADRWAARVVTINIAERIADQCYAEGLSLAPSPWSGAVARATGEMVAQGADPAALDAVYAAHDFNETEAAVSAYLAGRGVTDEAPGSLCALGRAEIAQATELGQVLQEL